MARLQGGDGFDDGQQNTDRRRPVRPAANTGAPSGQQPDKWPGQQPGKQPDKQPGKWPGKQSGTPPGNRLGKQPGEPARKSAGARPAGARPTGARPAGARPAGSATKSARPAGSAKKFARPGRHPRITQQTTRVALSLPKMETAPELWLRNIRMSGFAFTVLALVIVAVIVLSPGLRILVEQRQQIANLTASVEAGTTAVSTYQSDVARWSDPAYIEAQARQKLYYIFPGDRTYLVVDDGATIETSDGQPISDSIQSLQVDWVQSLVSSLYTAGLTEATGAELTTPSPTEPSPRSAPASPASPNVTNSSTTGGN